MFCVAEDHNIPSRTRQSQCGFKGRGVWICCAALKGFSVEEINGVSFSELQRGLEDILAASHAQYDAKVSFQIISKASI